jgi:hypothetical protein
VGTAGAFGMLGAGPRLSRGGRRLPRIPGSPKISVIPCAVANLNKPLSFRRATEGNKEEPAVPALWTSQ